MLGAAILWISLGSVGTGDYLQSFGSKTFDQTAFDAETFGDKKSLAREDDGLKVLLTPGQGEAGWKTPAGLRIGGDFTISATLVIRKLPKPPQEDGAAIGLAVATQNIDQPESTLIREIEPDGKDVYRAVNGGAAAVQPQQPMIVQRNRMNFFGGGGLAEKPPKPPRLTVPAKGLTFRLEVTRQGQTLHYQVFDELSKVPREIGQAAIGPGDLIGVKLFGSNRNATEPVEVLIRDLTIHADRITGLGTAVRTVYGTIVHADPTAIEPNILVVGGTPPAPVPDPNAKPDAAKPGAAEPAKAPTATPAAAPSPAPVAVVAPKAAVVLPPGAVVEGDDDDDAPVPPGGAPPQQPDQPPVPQRPKPRTPLPIDEVESIAFERASVLTGRFLGQPNVDATGPFTKSPNDAKAAKKPGETDDFTAPPPGTVPPVVIPRAVPKPNGIRDLHLGLSGLRPSAIQQVMIQCQTDKGPSSWKLDTTGSEDWPLIVSRSGTETWADLFLEPPAVDLFDKMLTVTVTYADGQAGNAQVKASSHTDAKLAFDPASASPPLNARIYLVGDEQLFGKLEAITEETLTLTTSWGDKVDIPMTRIIGVYPGMADHKESGESFTKRLKARGDKDLLLARSKDGEVVAISGIVEAARGDKLTFVYQDKPRTIPLKMVEGFVLAARPAPKPPTEVRATFTMGGGIAISGKWLAIEAATWKVETPWGQTLKLPAADVRQVRFQGGQMTYLSDLEPSQVEETPYFGRKVAYRKDESLSGGPLKLDGQSIEKGLAVHSRSSLTYDLDRRYATFEALVGFDESAKKKGRVDCRVFADGKEIYANPDLRADAPPVKLALPVTGAEQLKLVIDYGPDEDTGDRVIWANARLYRKASPAATTSPNPTPSGK